MSDHLYDKPAVALVGNLRDQLEAVPRIGGTPTRTTHKCGVCGRSVFSARWLEGGLLLHVERVDHGDLEIVPELFAGAGLPHVRRTKRTTGLLEHGFDRCGSHVGRAPARKARP